MALRGALKLGLTSFGGPIAHLGYFRNEYVVRRKWLDESTYADLVALPRLRPPECRFGLTEFDKAVTILSAMTEPCDFS
jgi:hypothetical protein